MFIEGKDGGSGGDKLELSRKAPVKSSPPSNQHPVFLQAGCPSCRPTNSVKALKGKYHTPWTCLPQTHLGSSNFVFDHYSSWLPWGRFAMPLISPLMPVPQFIPISYSHIGYVSSLCSINNKIPVTLPAAKC